MARVVADTFKSGTVSQLDFRAGQKIKLSDGWVAEKIYAGNIRDTYMVVVTEGSVLAKHLHPLEAEQVFVVSGAFEMQIWKDGPDAEPVKGRMGHTSAYRIPPNTYHEFKCVSEGDGIMLVVFEPPLAVPND